jgi:hypothetical protein
MPMTRFGVLLLLSSLPVAVVAGQTHLAAQVPVPFPTAGSRTPSPAQTAPDAAAGLPVYPAAQFLETFDAGKGQQYLLYGTDTAFADIVAYYKATLKDGGREIFKGPLIHQFELGRFQKETMAYPPSVVVKDYTWNGSDGYLHVAGTTSARYKTIIQIVPPPGR